MDLEMTIFQEVSETEKEMSCDITYMWNLKENDINEIIYKAETDLHLRKRTNLRLLGGKTLGEDTLGVWDWQVHIAVFKIDNQQGPTV